VPTLTWHFYKKDTIRGPTLLATGRGSILWPNTFYCSWNFPIGHGESVYIPVYIFLGWISWGYSGDESVRNLHRQGQTFFSVARSLVLQHWAVFHYRPTQIQYNCLPCLCTSNRQIEAWLGNIIWISQMHESTTACRLLSLANRKPSLWQIHNSTPCSDAWRPRIRRSVLKWIHGNRQLVSLWA